MPGHDLALAVDLRNAGQILACCGVLEAASRIDLSSLGWFEDGAFRLTCDGAGGTAMFERIVHGLRADGEFQIDPADDAAQHEPPVAPLTIRAPFALRVDWWLDARGETTNLKTWAGQMKVGTIVSDLRAAWTRLSDGAEAVPVFDRTMPLTGRFGFDPRASWRALDVGFSPNEQGIAVETSPIVDLLAAVGLQRFRPAPVRPDDDRLLSVLAWEEPSEPSVAALRLAGAIPSRGRRFEFRIENRAKYKNFSFADERADHEADKR